MSGPVFEEQHLPPWQPGLLRGAAGNQAGGSRWKALPGAALPSRLREERGAASRWQG